MKKLIVCFAVISLILMGIVSPAMATPVDSDIWVVANDAPTQKAATISTSTLIPGKHRILRIKVSNMFTYTNVGTQPRECFATVYDSATVGTASNTLLRAELESSTVDPAEEVFTRPQGFSNGVTIHQGAFTVVLIEYERYQP